jgi:hypothetical protein
MDASPEFRFPRALVLVVIALLAVVAGLYAQDPHEHESEGEEWEHSVETPIEIQSTTVQQKLDSVFANVDEQFKLVKPIFETACFDCHSTNTDFPWYAKIPGIKQYLNGHVKEGREHLDMTDGFPFKGEHQPLEALEKIKEELEEGEMPLLSYRLLHWSAWLSDAEKDSIYMWIDTSAVMIRNLYESEHLPDPKSTHDHD